MSHPSANKEPRPPCEAYWTVFDLLPAGWFLTKPPTKGLILSVFSNGRDVSTWYMEDSLARLIAGQCAVQQGVSVRLEDFDGVAPTLEAG